MSTCSLRGHCQGRPLQEIGSGVTLVKMWGDVTCSLPLSCPRLWLATGALALHPPSKPTAGQRHVPFTMETCRQDSQPDLRALQLTGQLRESKQGWEGTEGAVRLNQQVAHEQHAPQESAQESGVLGTISGHPQESPNPFPAVIKPRKQRPNPKTLALAEPGPPLLHSLFPGCFY